MRIRKTPTDRFFQSSTCACGKSYIVQTGREIKIWIKEYEQDVEYQRSEDTDTEKRPEKNHK